MLIFPLSFEIITLQHLNLFVSPHRTSRVSDRISSCSHKLCHSSTCYPSLEGLEYFIFLPFLGTSVFHNWKGCFDCFLILSPSFPTTLSVFLLDLSIHVKRRASHMNISGAFDFLKIHWAKMPRWEYREISQGFKGKLWKTYVHGQDQSMLVHHPLVLEVVRQSLEGKRRWLLGKRSLKNDTEVTAREEFGGTCEGLEHSWPIAEFLWRVTGLQYCFPLLLTSSVATAKWRPLWGQLLHPILIERHPSAHLMFLQGGGRQLLLSQCLQCSGDNNMHTHADDTGLSCFLRTDKG